jgi:hypothetical protein
MNKEEAKKILGDRADWEIKAMKKALTSLGGFFNNDKDNERLEAIETIEKSK